MTRSNKLESFFTGYLYPVIVAILILLGNIFAIEVYLNTINVLLVCLALLTCRTIRPLLPFLITFIYQVSNKYTPSKPAASDFYFTGWRAPLHLCLIGLLVFSIIVCLCRSGVFRLRNPLTIPLLLPTILFTVGMLANGYGHPEYYEMNFVWGLGVAVSIGVLFYIYYLGMQNEDPEELVSYFTFLTFVVSWILILEMAHGLLFCNWIVDGHIIRGSVQMGYGVNNLVAYNISMLIPINMYGFMKSRHPMACLVTAVLLYLATLITMSRNSILFGGIFFLIAFATAMFFGERKKLARAAFLTLALTAVLLLAFYGDVIRDLFKSMIDKGTSDSGRFDIWRMSFDLFREYPVFGAGFFGLRYSNGPFLPATIVPDFSHNTVFQLLGTTGLVGFIGYSVYRLATIKRILSHVNIEKWMFGLGALILAGESLLDNYVFNFYTAFYPIAALAILVLLDESQNSTRRSDAYFIKHWRS